jgi:hypothetical protein
MRPDRKLDIGSGARSMCDQHKQEGGNNNS